MKTLLAAAALMFAACTTDDQPPPNDGFGEACEAGNWVEGHSWSSCESLLGERGMCMQFSPDSQPECSRFCIGGEGNPDACPVGQTARATVEGLCVCQP